MAACRCQRIGETTKGPKRAQGRNNRKKKQPTATARGNNEPDVGGRRGGAARPGGMEKLNTTRNMGGSKMETQQNGENGKSASVANAACWPAREERSTTWTQTAKDRDSPRQQSNKHSTCRYSQPAGNNPAAWAIAIVRCPRHGCVPDNRPVTLGLPLLLPGGDDGDSGDWRHQDPGPPIPREARAPVIGTQHAGRRTHG